MKKKIIVAVMACGMMLLGGCENAEVIAYLPDHMGAVSSMTGTLEIGLGFDVRCLWSETEEEIRLSGEWELVNKTGDFHFDGMFCSEGDGENTEQELEIYWMPDEANYEYYLKLEDKWCNGKVGKSGEKELSEWAKAVYIETAFTAAIWETLAVEADESECTWEMTLDGEKIAYLVWMLSEKITVEEMSQALGMDFTEVEAKVFMSANQSDGLLSQVEIDFGKELNSLVPTEENIGIPGFKVEGIKDFSAKIYFEEYDTIETIALSQEDFEKIG